MCDKAGDGLRAYGGFDEPDQWRSTWTHGYTGDAWLDPVPTFGGHSQIPVARLEELPRGLAAAIDPAGGAFEIAYATVVVTAERSG